MLALRKRKRKKARRGAGSGTLTLFLAIACFLTGCSAGGKELSSSRPQQEVTSAPSQKPVTLGAVELRDGLLLLGTGYGTVTLRVGDSMKLVNETYEENGNTSVMAVDDSSAILRLGPLRSINQEISAQDFSVLLRSQGAQEAQPLSINNVGNAKAVGVEVKDAKGAVSVMYAVQIHGSTWLLSVTASTENKRKQLVEIAQTLKVEELDASGGGIGAGVSTTEDKEDSAPAVKNTTSPAGQENGVGNSEKEGQESERSEKSDPLEKKGSIENISRDGKVRGFLDSSGYTLSAPGGKIRFFAADLQAISQASGDFIGVRKNYVNMLFTSATADDFLSPAKLADVLAKQNSGNVASFGAMDDKQIAGYPASGAYVKLLNGGALYFYVLNMDGRYLAIVLQTNDMQTYPADFMLEIMRSSKKERKQSAKPRRIPPYTVTSSRWA